jgi:hypothetical protein
MSIVLPFGGSALVTVPNGACLAVFSVAPYSVSLITAPIDLNGTEVPLFNGKGGFTSATYANGATIAISGGGDAELFYSVGVSAAVVDIMPTILPAPTALDVTGDVTAAMILGGILTSAAATVTGTLPTGAVMDAAGSFAIGDVIRWSIIKVGANAFTLAPAASGHTIIGATVVATATSASYVTRKTAAETFVTYRVS